MARTRATIGRPSFKPLIRVKRRTRYSPSRPSAAIRSEARKERARAARPDPLDRNASGVAGSKPYRSTSSSPQHSGSVAAIPFGHPPADGPAIAASIDIVRSPRKENSPTFRTRQKAGILPNFLHASCVAPEKRGISTAVKTGRTEPTGNIPDSSGRNSAAAARPQQRRRFRFPPPTMPRQGQRPEETRPTSPARGMPRT